jgi:hypothetical protein
MNERRWSGKIKRANLVIFSIFAVVLDSAKWKKFLNIFFFANCNGLFDVNVLYISLT